MRNGIVKHTCKKHIGIIFIRLLMFVFCCVLVYTHTVKSEGISSAEDDLFDLNIITPIPIGRLTGYRVDDRYYTAPYEYLDPSLHIEITKDRYLDTDIWIAKVKLSHPSQIRCAFASKYGKQVNVVGATIAKRVNAVMAVNAGYHSYSNSGVVVMQGHMYRNKPNGSNDILIIDDKGDLHAVIDATKKSFSAVYEAMGGTWEEGGHIINVITFGPVLIQNGEYAHEKFERYNTGVDKLTQRMVIAQTAPLTYLLITCEGPESSKSKGLTVKQMAEYVYSLNCHFAYNLDGGSSSTLVFKNKKINSPETKIRPIADIIYFATCMDVWALGE